MKEIRALVIAVGIALAMPCRAEDSTLKANGIAWTVIGAVIAVAGAGMILGLYEASRNSSSSDNAGAAGVLLPLGFGAIGIGAGGVIVGVPMWVAAARRRKARHASIVPAGTGLLVRF